MFPVNGRLSDKINTFFQINDKYIHQQYSTNKYKISMDGSLSHFAFRETVRLIFQCPGAITDTGAL